MNNKTLLSLLFHTLQDIVYLPASGKPHKQAHVNVYQRHGDKL